MRIIRAADCRRMPWKNGGGETIEIAVSPAGAGLDDFDWRVSMARVEVDGPFSTFPGIDRTLAILEGEGMMLEIEGRSPGTLTVGSLPLSFPADVATAASLIAGPISDLNVMSRRGRSTHSVTRFAVREPVELVAAADATFILCQAGNAHAVADGEELEIGRFDALLIQTGHRMRLEAEARSLFLKVEIRHASPS